MPDAPSILFVCVHNAGRSQMAAAFAKALGRDAVRVRSAGSRPADRVHPVVVAAMAEAGVDLAGARPSSLAEVDVRASDVVVTMGCGDACPVLPGRRSEDWALPDPAGLPLEAVRAVRDEIRERVRVLLDELTAGSVPEAR